MHGHPPPPPPPYAMLNNGGHPNYPPNSPYYYPNAPQYYAAPRRKKSSGCAGSCCRCICCFCCFFIILFLIQLLTALYFYLAYDPKVPSYNVETIDVKSFDLTPDSTLATNIHVVIRAENPNKHMEFIYRNDSALVVEYSNVGICAGKLPAFRQGRVNTTVFAADLTGASPFGPNLLRDFMENQKNRRIPLMVKMKVPINVILGDVTLKEIKVLVNCSMVVDGLSPNKTSQIISKETVFAIEV
ncbi:hypothetical protein ACS0TY_017480 [Phlomoides rotata]